MSAFFAFPPEASHYAAQVDLLSASVGLLVALLSAPVFILMLFFSLRYRKGRRADRTPSVNHSILIETSWALIPFLLILVFYVWATVLFVKLHDPPADALTINVVAKQWMWKFQHPEGAREINDLHVPVGRPVRLVMTSQDVIHSLYIPALRIKQDVLPGRYTSLWFTVDKPGHYALRCAEYCGTDHSQMTGGFIAMRAGDYARWLSRSSLGKGLAERGERLFHQLGCSGCHAPGAAVRAPPLSGLYGSPVPLADGRIVTADDQYIHDSIMLPNQDVAAGYKPIMPTFGNVLDEEQVVELKAYIKSLGNSGSVKP